MGQFLDQFPTLTDDPAWPWSTAHYGVPALALVALLLAGLTAWTYVGVPGASSRRVLTMLALRLFALALACLMLLRPSFAVRETDQPPSTLLIVVDASQSMTIQDEVGGQSRWEYVRRLLREAGPALDKLQQEKNVKLAVYRFGEDVQDDDPAGAANGKRTDFGTLLHDLIERHGQDRNLRGILILSDGADNGVRYAALTEAARWRSLPCPIQTFGVGRPTTGDKQRDIAFVSRPGLPAIQVNPSPAPVKSQLTVRGTLDAPGFENETVTVHLLIDDKEVLARRRTLTKTVGNEITLTTDAPAEAGEIKVTLKVDPKEGEVTRTNNEISTFLTVTKEGLSVLVIDRPRFPEPQLLCDALTPDRRIRVYPVWLRDDQGGGQEPDLFGFDKHAYDVIILGDVSAERLRAADPQVLQRIQALVRDKGAGLLMMGGDDTFGNRDWLGTPLADLSPVKLDSSVGQIDQEVRIEPTAVGRSHYIRVAESAKDNEALWGKLPPLDGMTVLGDAKPLAAVLATSVDSGGGRHPVLVGEDYGKGRTLAFGGDTTWRWMRLGQPKTNEGVAAHDRFWRQVVLWLAQQDKIEGNVYVKPGSRRIPTGGKLAFQVGLRGKGGKELDDAHFEVTVLGPAREQFPVPTARERGEQRGIFWKTERPGEYHLQVKGWPKGVDTKKTATEKADIRFIVYEDEAEMARRAADHEFLERLAEAGGGKFHRAADFPRFVQDLRQMPLAQARDRPTLWPDWRKTTLSGFLVGLFLLFVSVLCLEWFLRRRWGLV